MACSGHDSHVHFPVGFRIGPVSLSSGATNALDGEFLCQGAGLRITAVSTELSNHGLKIGDVIAAINGISTLLLPYDFVLSLIHQHAREMCLHAIRNWTEITAWPPLLQFDVALSRFPDCGFGFVPNEITVDSSGVIDKIPLADVTRGSSAHFEGVRPWDAIVAINGESVIQRTGLVSDENETHVMNPKKRALAAILSARRENAVAREFRNSLNGGVPSLSTSIEKSKRKVDFTITVVFTIARSTWIETPDLGMPYLNPLCITNPKNKAYRLSMPRDNGGSHPRIIARQLQEEILVLKPANGSWGFVPSVVLGQGQDLSASTYATQGVYISSVKEGSSAAIAGIRAGDVIVAIDGDPIQKRMKLEDVFSALREAARETESSAYGGGQTRFTVVHPKVERIGPGPLSMTLVAEGYRNLVFTVVTDGGQLGLTARRQMTNIGSSAEDNVCGHLQIDSVRPDFPAARAGILVGDIIVRLNDVLMGKMTYPDAMEYLKNARGPAVLLGILRAENVVNVVKQHHLVLPMYSPSSVVRVSPPVPHPPLAPSPAASLSPVSFFSSYTDGKSWWL